MKVLHVSDRKTGFVLRIIARKYFPKKLEKIFFEIVFMIKISENPISENSVRKFHPRKFYLRIFHLRKYSKYITLKMKVLHVSDRKTALATYHR